MKCILEVANTYVKESDWKTMALLKICLCAMGVMIGLGIGRSKKKPAFFIAMSLFIGTCVPLVWKFVEIVKREACGE